MPPLLTHLAQDVTCELDADVCDHDRQVLVLLTAHDVHVGCDDVHRLPACSRQRQRHQGSTSSHAHTNGRDTERHRHTDEWADSLTDDRRSAGSIEMPRTGAPAFTSQKKGDKRTRIQDWHHPHTKFADENQVL